MDVEAVNPTPVERIMIQMSRADALLKIRTWQQQLNNRRPSIPLAHMNEYAEAFGYELVDTRRVTAKFELGEGFSTHPHYEVLDMWFRQPLEPQQ